MAMKFFRRMKPFNRRQFARLNINCIAKFEVDIEGKKASVLTNIVNLSEGGVLLVTFDRRVPKSALVEMKFQLPGVKKPFSVLGQVRSTTEVRKGMFRSGIQFLNLSDEDDKAIKGFVNAHLKPSKK